MGFVYSIFSGLPRINPTAENKMEFSFYTDNPQLATKQNVIADGDLIIAHTSGIYYII